MWKMEHKMTFFGMTVKKVARVHHLQKMELQLKNHWTNFLLNKKDRKECVCSANFKFPFHSGRFSITFQFKCVLNILLF
jgi:hypothetical protein